MLECAYIYMHICTEHRVYVFAQRDGRGTGDLPRRLEANQCNSHIRFPQSCMPILAFLYMPPNPRVKIYWNFECIESNHCAYMKGGGGKISPDWLAQSARICQCYMSDCFRFVYYIARVWSKKVNGKCIDLILYGWEFFNIWIDKDIFYSFIFHDTRVFIQWYFIQKCIIDFVGITKSSMVVFLFLVPLRLVYSDTD